MRILVLGGDGMLGHQVFLELRQRQAVRVTLRQPLEAYAGGLFDAGNAFGGIDVRAPERLAAVLSEYQPQAVVNAVGIVKQRKESDDAIVSLEVNSLLPHRLAIACRALGAQLVQVSTDCVFSGERGGYREEDRPDPPDLYGLSKLAGEVSAEGAVTLRTSMIGLGLNRKTSLIDWFLTQHGRISGYRGAIFSGFTTRELARIIARVVERHPQASGLYHASATPISKYDLLVQLRDRLGKPLDIVPVDEPRIDRSLNSTRFRRVFDYQPPSWDAMLDELATDIERKAA
ncbi:MAG TPA: SDR family oxidoreductase [Burkholderiales bacterium]